MKTHSYVLKTRGAGFYAHTVLTVDGNTFRHGIIHRANGIASDHFIRDTRTEVRHGREISALRGRILLTAHLRATRARLHGEIALRTGSSREYLRQHATLLLEQKSKHSRQDGNSIIEWLRRPLRTSYHHGRFLCQLLTKTS